MTTQELKQQIAEMELPIAALNRDQSYRARIQSDVDTVQEYAERIKKNEKLPSVVVFPTQEVAGATHRLVGGFMTVEAAELAGKKTIAALVVPDLPAAFRLATESNTRHGNRLTNADKRKAVLIALKLFPGDSNAKIAELCAVSDQTVENHRSQNLGPEPEIRGGKDGKKYNISRAKKKPKSAKAKAKALEVEPLPTATAEPGEMQDCAPAAVRESAPEVAEDERLNDCPPIGTPYGFIPQLRQEAEEAMQVIEADCQELNAMHAEHKHIERKDLWAIYDRYILLCKISNSIRASGASVAA